MLPTRSWCVVASSRVAVALCAALLLASTPAVLSQPETQWSFDADREGVAVDAGQAKLDGDIISATHVAGRNGHGRALRFDRTDAVVKFPASPVIAFDHTKSFTVNFWIRTTQSQGFATPVMAKDRPNGAVSYSFCLGRTPGVLSFELWSWGSVKLPTRQPISDGKWHQVSGAYDAQTNIACLLLDGQMQSLHVAGKGGPQQVALRLGNNIDSAQPFRGDLDDVEITSGVSETLRGTIAMHESWNMLTAAEIEHSQQAYLDRMAAPKFLLAKTSDEWRKHATEVRQHVLECLGLSPLPERLPLNPHVAGVIEHEHYTLKRIYWQTWPHYYASGWLYMPKQAKLPAPAVLCPHGHFEHGVRDPIVQARCISLATKGYVVLAVDSVHVYNWSAGLVPLTVMTWNNIRGLDLLCSMPEVDPKRLGCTGCSGGAQQTFYLMAIEDRLSVAIPVCMVSEWRTILWTTWNHCECNHVPGILAETDTPELAACFAPRPSLMICVTKDWTATFPKHGFPQIKHTYDLFGAGDKTQCTQYDWVHDYSLPMREQAYGVFNHYLMGIDDPAQAKEPKHTPETLEAMTRLDGPPADAVGPATIAADLLKRRGFDASPIAGNAGARLDGIRGAFIELTHEAGVGDEAGVRTIGGAEEVDGCRVERLALTSEKEVTVPVAVISPSAGEATARRPAVLFLDADGKAGFLTARWGLVRDLVKRGLIVCAADVRPYGELGLNRGPQEVNGTVFGRPELAVAAHDATRVAAYLRTRAGTDPAQVACVGFGEAAVVALAAGVYDSALSRIGALAVGDTYAAGGRLPRCPRVLTVGDLPQLAGALAPRPVWIQGASRPDAYTWTAGAYVRRGAKTSLRLTQAAASDADLVEWLAATK